MSTNNCPNFIPDARIPRCKLDGTPCIFASTQQWCEKNPNNELPKSKGGKR
jgi:hypothetical protein